MSDARFRAIEASDSDFFRTALRDLFKPHHVSSPLFTGLDAIFRDWLDGKVQINFRCQSLGGVPPHFVDFLIQVTGDLGGNGAYHAPK